MELPIGQLQTIVPISVPLPEREIDNRPFITLRELERDHILKVLEYTGGQKLRAARILGCTLKTIYNRLHQYGLYDQYCYHRIKRAGNGVLL